MTPILQTFDRAILYHQTGNLQQAEQLYRYVLQGNPLHAEALHLLGLLCHQTGRSDLAVGHIREALRLRPDLSEAHSNLGSILRRQGKLDEAVASLRQALQLDPQCAAAYNNLGNALCDQKKYDEALPVLKQCLALTPNSAETHHNLGIAYRGQGKLDEAMACYREALRLRPDFAEALNSLGNVYKDLDRFADAAQCYRQAVRHKPSLFEVHHFLGLVLQQQGEFEEALTCYQEAIRHMPEFFEAHFSRGTQLLLLGQFEQGWPEYEWRWRDKKFYPQLQRFSQPIWNGSDLTGKTILLHTEQGLGDSIQFVRYAALLEKRGGTVIFECRNPLARLLARVPGVAQLVPCGRPLPHFDVHLPLLSAPRMCGTTLTTIPADIPYILAEPELVERWRQEIEKEELGRRREEEKGKEGEKLSPLLPFFRVGISWQGNPDHDGDHYRSFPLACFEPLARVPGVQLFSLQKDFGTEQIAAAVERFRVVDLDNRIKDFTDTAALMMNFDLVVTVDSATAHLAGALGVPVWLALPFVPDWRWLLNRADSPWYPTMKLFRQTAWGDWSGVFERMAEALAALVAVNELPVSAKPKTAI